MTQNRTIFPTAWTTYLGACMLLGAAVLASGAATAATMDRTGVLWAPYVEWTLDNPTYTGNPYDVVATATFVHQATNETHTAEMFYTGGTIWKFRFAGTRTGDWAFTTQSADPELDGHDGTVTITDNPDPAIKGFVTHAGNKWARQIDGAGSIETFVPNFVMVSENTKDFSSAYIDARLSTFFDQHGFNGFATFLASRWVDIDSNSKFTTTTRRDPDPRTFDALERLITKTHAAGGMVHIWYVGDCARDQCAQAGFGTAGAQDPRERRLLRYIAARLAPLPGWIMGYGYDNPEHVNTTQLDGWGSYLRSHMGWRHYLGARNQSRASYTFWPNADFYSWGQLGWTYSDVVNAISQETNKPHSLDERFWNGRMNMDEQRRGLWAFTMAGGASAIWAWDRTPTGSSAYPNPEQIATYSRFWRDRFLPDLRRCNSLTDGYCLKSADDKNYVFYRTNASSIRLGLSALPAAANAIAVDTKTQYAETAIGSLNPTDQTWTAPYASDWAIAVGFSGGGSPVSQVPHAPVNVQVQVQ